MRGSASTCFGGLAFPFLLCALCFAGCAEGGAAPVDSGTGARDAFVAQDTGVSRTDAGATSDGGAADAGSPVDAGSLMDAGSTSDAGTVDAGIDAGMPDAGCSSDAMCDDGMACNGAETCNSGVCQAGTPVDCDDGVACTVDSCNDADGSCTNMADDAMCSGGMMCDATSGCVAACAESPCRVVGPQCGCATGQGCYLDGMGGRECLPAGTDSENETCTSGSCAPGLICVSAGTTALCKRACETNADCTGGAGSLCVATITGSMPEVRVCSSHCNPVTGGCPSNTNCGLFVTTGTMERLSDCSAAGTGGDGALCTDDTGCQSGFTCINTGTSNRCLQWCRRSRGDLDCPGLFDSCLRVGPAPGLVFDGAEYGVCN